MSAYSEEQEERRREPAVTRGEFAAFVLESNAQRQELRDLMRSVQGSVVEIKRDIKCIHDTWDTHITEYGDILKDAKKTQINHDKLRNAVIEKSLTGAVWAMVVFVAIAAWDWVRAHVK